MRVRVFGLIIIAISFVHASWLAAEETQKGLSPPHESGVKNGESLSQKLDRQKGVIKPKPGIDPQGAKQPPEPNPESMPVIRPPARPGTQAK
jgi:hypothetical protein